VHRWRSCLPSRGGLTKFAGKISHVQIWQFPRHCPGLCNLCSNRPIRINVGIVISTARLFASTLRPLIALGPRGHLRAACLESPGPGARGPGPCACCVFILVLSPPRGRRVLASFNIGFVRWFFPVYWLLYQLLGSKRGALQPRAT